MIRGYHKISRKDLEKKIALMPPQNSNREMGYTLVNVLKPDSFEKERIPNSINIPLSEVEEFEKRFDKDKEIIVYCASPECDASPKAAKKLAESGFNNVHDYAEGLSGWKDAGNPTAGAQS